MKKNLKKIIPAVMAISMLATSAVFAENELKDAQNPVLEAPAENVNNSQDKLLAVKLVEKDGYKLFPVREVFESLGFEVGYDANSKVVTVANAPLYVTFSQKSDAYTFARTAPQKLGIAPVVIEGKTYVPVTLLTELMGMEGVNVDGLTLTIKLESEEKALPELKQNIIIGLDEEAKTITIMDAEKGEIVLNIKDLKIEYTTDAKTLMLGQAVEVVYGDTMTTSQPPMNTPKSLKVVQRYDLVEVISVEEQDGEKRVLVKDANLGEVLLLISKDTKVAEGVKFEKGQILKVAMSEAMTMSIPPQTVAKEISVFEVENTEDLENAEEDGIEVTITSVDKENKQITIKDEELGDVILNLNEDNKDLIYVGIDQSDIDSFNWHEQQKIKVVYGEIMTRSLPPVNNPVKIIVL